MSCKLHENDDALLGMEAVMEQLFGPLWHEDNSLERTPLRFLKYLNEYNNDHTDTYKEIFSRQFDLKGDPQMVVQNRIPFRMVCEHHLLPGLGYAYIGYIPSEKLIGISKLARLVELVGTERPSLQEHIGNRVAELLDEALNTMGTVVHIRSTHGCMSCRGVRTPDVETLTTSVRGVFRDVAEKAREEFFAQIKVD